MNLLQATIFLVSLVTLTTKAKGNMREALIICQEGAEEYVLKASASVEAYKKAELEAVATAFLDAQNAAAVLTDAAGKAANDTDNTDNLINFQLSLFAFMYSMNAAKEMASSGDRSELNLVSNFPFSSRCKAARILVKDAIVAGVDAAIEAPKKIAEEFALARSAPLKEIKKLSDDAQEAFRGSGRVSPNEVITSVAEIATNAAKIASNAVDLASTVDAYQEATQGTTIDAYREATQAVAAFSDTLISISGSDSISDKYILLKSLFSRYANDVNQLVSDAAKIADDVDALADKVHTYKKATQDAADTLRSMSDNVLRLWTIIKIT